MSKERKPQEEEGAPRMEKETMKEPQEEFIGEEARPSKSMAEVREKKEGAEEGRSGELGAARLSKSPTE